MDGDRFDSLTRALGAGRSRRGILKGLGAAALGAAGLGRLGVADANAGNGIPLNPSTCPPATYPCLAYAKQPNAVNEILDCCTHDQVCLKCSAVDPQTGSTATAAGCCTPGVDCDAMRETLAANGRHAAVCREIVE